MIKCLVVGGRPSPEVTWWRDHHLVDDSFSQISEFKVENLLTLPSLLRSDVDSILTCQAKNNNNSVPVLMMMCFNAAWLLRNKDCSDSIQLLSGILSDLLLLT